MLSIDYTFKYPFDFTVKANPMRNYSQCLVKSDKSHVERMVDEYNQLITRFNALEAFIEGSHIFKELPSHKKQLLMHQRRVMDEYAVILNERINIEINES